MEIKYNTPINVTKEQFDRVRKYLHWAIAYRVLDGQYQIKLWEMRHKKYLELLLK